MLRFLSFGSGSSGNCYYLYNETDGLIIDTGIPLRTLKKYFRDFGLTLSHVHHVLITHDHADHIKAVGSISHELHLPIHATAAVHDGIDRNYCVQRKLPADMRRYITPGEPLTLGSFHITPFSVPHDASQNVGFFINVQGVNFCIITDAGTITPDMLPFINQAHYLVIEANHDQEMLLHGPYPHHLKTRIKSSTGHLSNNDCATAIAENMSQQLQHVWLCHLSQENNHPELARKTVETILRAHGIIPGHHLLLDVLKHNTPTGIFELNTQLNADH